MMQWQQLRRPASALTALTARLQRAQCAPAIAASAQTLGLQQRFRSSGADAKGKAGSSNGQELTNEKIWDRVLANHPEQDEHKNGDLLYEYPRKGYFGLMSAGSLAHIAFWSWFKGYEQSLIEMHPVLGDPTFFSWVTNDFGSSLGFGTSIVLAGLIGFHARRAVARISIVAGGDKLRLTPHKFFGDYGEPIDVPVGLVSAHPNTKSNIILKLGDKRGFYLVDTRGNFYNRKKLESMITFRTSWDEHDKMIKKKTMYEVRTDLPRTELKPFPQSTPKTLSNKSATSAATRTTRNPQAGKKKPSTSRKPRTKKH